MRFLGRRDNSNTLAGLVLLVLLAVFAGPTVFPELLTTLGEMVQVIEIDEGAPCDRLRTAEDRTTHQSLIGRAVADEIDSPLSLSVRTGGLPETQDGNLVISVIVRNTTIGTIPILVTPDALILDPNQPINGLGVVFNGAVVTNPGENITSYPEDRMRLLGPRQTCVHRVSIPVAQIGSLSALTAENSTIRAFYRNTVAGQAIPNGTDAVIYTDQGLWTGLVTSDNVPISN